MEKGKKNMRNLILVHLESLNYMNYHVNACLFPNLSELEKKSVSFPYYYSTATSTLMVLADLMYGGMLQYEVCDSLDAVPEKYCYKESLFDSLKDKGYRTKALYYPGGSDCINAEKRHVAGFQCELTALLKYEEYIAEIEQILGSQQPFALMLCNTVSNIALNYQVSSTRADSGLDRWKYGYIFMDDCVGTIMKLLEANNLLDNTTIIFYGDHGDEYYMHGNHQGLTHAIEPYNSLIHTPFWIYDNRWAKSEKINDLLCTTDIRMIVEKLLEMPELYFTWEDLEISERSYVIARNAYACQPVRKESFNKGYSLTDGRFLLLVNDSGLAFYDTEMDIYCQNNLLKFFIYDQGILFLNKDLNSSLKYHYKFLINIGAIRQIRQLFYYYKNKLYEEVTKLFQYAGCEEKIKELGFEKIQKL